MSNFDELKRLAEDLESQNDSTPGIERALNRAKASAAILELLAQRDELLEALEKIIRMNRRRAYDQWGDQEKAESMSCVVVARAAIANATNATKGTP